MSNTNKGNPVTRAINQFYQLMSEYGDYGAADSEPQRFFHHLLKKAVSGDDFPEVDPADWELYSTVDIDNEVAEELTAKAKELHYFIMEAKHHHVAEAADWFGIET